MLATHKAPRPAAAVVIVGSNREDVSGQSTDQTMWHYVRSCSGARPSIGAFQAATSDCYCDNYRPVSSMRAVEQGMRETCFHARYRLISGRRDNRKVADSTIDIATLRNPYEPYRTPSFHSRSYHKCHSSVICRVGVVMTQQTGAPVLPTN